MTSMPALSSLNSAPVDAAAIPTSNQALTAELTRLAGHINAAQYRFLRLLAALIERNAWGGDCGMKSPAHWLNYFCGIDLGAAREKVRVTRALQSLPQIDEAFASGAISYSKVRAMTRSATPDNEAVLLNVARHGTAQHVETLVRQHQRVQRLNKLDASSQDAGHPARELHWFFDEDGMLVIKGRFAPEEGAVLLKALEAALDSVAANEPSQSTDVSAETSASGSTGNDTDTETEFTTEHAPKTTFPQKRADALQLISEHFLATRQQGAQALAGADKYQVVIHLDARSGCVVNQLGLCACLDDGPPLPDTTCKRLTCDASLITVLRDDTGNVLNIGRKTRTVPPAIRRALKIRDGGCRHPGCTQTRFVDAHHIQHWSDGGETSLDNLVLLCRHHHRQLHEHVFTIERNSDGKNALRFLDSHGREIRPTLWPQFAAPVCDADGCLGIELDNVRYGLKIDADTAVTMWQGERMDYGMALGAMEKRAGIA